MSGYNGVLQSKIASSFARKLAPVIRQVEARLPERARWIVRLPVWVWGCLALVAILLIGRLAGSAHPDQSAAGSALPNTTLLAFDAVAKLGVVLALFFMGVYAWRGWRKFLPNQPVRRITLVETTRLSQRQALHLVRVGGQLLLIGATDQGLSLLTEVEETPAAQPADFFTELAVREGAHYNAAENYFDFSTFVEAETR
jgi:flagellar biogenesis protein FliO